jgi:hypothetical protein
MSGGAMPTASTKRAWIAVAVLAVLAVTAGVFYLHRARRPLPPPAPAAGPPPDLMSLIPASAPVVAYIDVAALRKLQNSPLAALLGLTGTDPQQDRDYQDFVRGTGFDYARDLDATAIAIWPSSLVAPHGGLGSNQVLALADGRFDQAKIEAYALRTGKTTVRGTRTIYVVPGEPATSFSFLSATRILLTTGESLSVLTIKPSTEDTDAMRARIKRVAGAPIFAAARTDAFPKSFHDVFQNSPQLETLARSVKGLTLAGQPQGDRIDLAIDGECDSLAHAAELATLLDTLRMFGSVALSDSKTQKQMTKEQAAFLAAFVREVRVTHQDHWVRLTLAVTPEMLGLANPKNAELR